MVVFVSQISKCTGVTRSAAPIEREQLVASVQLYVAKLAGVEYPKIVEATVIEQGATAHETIVRGPEKLPFIKSRFIEFKTSSP
jgi:hypothetical protein